MPSTIATASRPAGGRCRRAQRRQARRSEAPPRTWTNCIGASTIANSSPRSNSRASAAVAVAGRPAARRPPVEGGDELGVEVEPVHPVPVPGQVEGDPAGAAAEVEDRLAGRVGELPPQGQVAVVAAALDVMPDHRFRRCSALARHHHDRSLAARFRVRSALVSSPELLRQAPGGEQLAQLEQGRVGGEGEEAIRGRGEGARRARRRSAARPRSGPAASRRTSAAAPSPAPGCRSRSPADASRRAARSRRPRPRRRRGRRRSGR